MLRREFPLASTRLIHPSLALGVMLSLMASIADCAPPRLPSTSPLRSVARADVAHRASGGSVVVGTLTLAGHERQAWIAELDPNGSVLRERAFAGLGSGASFTKVALLPSGGCVVGMSLEDGTPDAPIFRAGLVWLGADLLPTQSSELGVGCASAFMVSMV